MSTTPIRIEDDLMERVSGAAERAGKTSHAFILEAIAQTLEQAEQDDAFQRLAEQRWAKLLATGKTVPWESARDYLAARSRGKQPRKPTARYRTQACQPPR